MASATLRDALERNVRYGRLVSDAGISRLEETGDRARFVLDLAPGRPEPAHEAMDAMISLIARTCRTLTAGKVDPLSVRLRRPEPEKAAEVWARVFRAPVVFGCATNVLEYPRACLDARLPTGNADLARANEEIVARYLAKFDEENLAARVRAHLVEQLSSGAPTPEAIAKALGTSHRSLQRRLTEEGTSYKEILNETRRNLACAYLEKGSTSITELTFLLGFSDTSTFARAFKRWTGVAPRDWPSS
jgi:AraC-like DNA-binding protein